METVGYLVSFSQLNLIDYCEVLFKKRHFKKNGPFSWIEFNCEETVYFLPQSPHFVSDIPFISVTGSNPGQVYFQSFWVHNLA